VDWKAEAEKQRGINQRLKKKLEKAARPEAGAGEKSPNEPDYGQKAFIASVLGVKGEDENAIVQEYLANGKKLDDLTSNKHFQNDLADLREKKSVMDATPPTDKRVGQVAADTVEYWIAKGELPPASNPKLRQDVVKAKYDIAKANRQ